MGFSQPIEFNILNAIFQGSSFTVNSQYLALFEATPDSVSSGTELDMSPVTGYQRIGVTSWSTPTVSAQTQNFDTITFGPLNISIQSIDGMGIFDNSSEGTRIMQEFFPGGAITATSGDTVTISPLGLITRVESV